MESIDIISIIKENEKGKIALVSVGGPGQLAILKTYENVRNKDMYGRLSRLSSLYIPRIYEVWTDESGLNVLEEYIEGRTLEECLESGEKVTREQFFDRALELASAIKSFHDLKPPILHRDIKPGNVLITPAGEVKLIDFDAAREYKEGRSSDTVLLGTKEYAPPEQYGYSQTDKRSDIYSYGCVLSEMLKAAAVDDDLRQQITAIIDKATRFDPSVRYSDFKDLTDDLMAAKAHRKASPAHRRKWSGKDFIKSAVVMALSIVIVSAGIAAGNRINNAGIIFSSGKASSTDNDGSAGQGSGEVSGSIESNGPGNMGENGSEAGDAEQTMYELGSSVQNSAGVSESDLIDTGLTGFGKESAESDVTEGIFTDTREQAESSGSERTFEHYSLDTYLSDIENDPGMAIYLEFGEKDEHLYDTSPEMYGCYGSTGPDYRADLLEDEQLIPENSYILRYFKGGKAGLRISASYMLAVTEAKMGKIKLDDPSEWLEDTVEDAHFSYMGNNVISFDKEWLEGFEEGVYLIVLQTRVGNMGTECNIYLVVYGEGRRNDKFPATLLQRCRFYSNNSQNRIEVYLNGTPEPIEKVYDFENDYVLREGIDYEKTEDGFGILFTDEFLSREWESDSIQYEFHAGNGSVSVVRISNITDY